MTQTTVANEKKNFISFHIYHFQRRCITQNTIIKFKNEKIIFP